MNTFISTNSIIQLKLLNRNKLLSRGKKEIIKVTQKRSSTWHYLYRLTRKFKFKESNINKNKQL